MDTDGDGLDDGEEVGCLRRWIDDGDPLAVAGTDGWTAVGTRDDQCVGGTVFAFGESLKFRGGRLDGVLCQWSGVLLVGDDADLSAPVPDTPADLSAAGNVSGGHRSVTEGTACGSMPTTPSRPGCSARRRSRLSLPRRACLGCTGSSRSGTRRR